MKKRTTHSILALVLVVAMVVGYVPAMTIAEETPSALPADSVTNEYTVPAGETFTPETYEYGFDSNFGLGKDYLFVIKKDGKYYAMREMSVSEEAFDTIGAVEVTDWIAADGKSVTIPADPGDVAFIRYEDVNPSSYEEDFVKRVNGNACLGYDLTRVWDAGYDNVLSETMRFTAQSADASGSSMLWHTKSDNYSGTFYQYSSRYINYKNYYVDYVVDLREDGNGGYEFYWRAINDEALGYDDWQIQREQDFGVEGYLFCGSCRHQSQIDHVEYDAPTCMEKGCAEYWYCHGCERYFKDVALTQPHKAYLTPDGCYEPILAATGHDWGTSGCNNCGLETPVYTKITSMEQLVALGDNASFILVAQYGDKTYVIDGGDPADLAKKMDANGDMYEDIIEIDDNNNGTPDCLEIDEDENGVWDYLETDLVNNDGVVNWYDYQDYWYNMNFDGLFDDVYSANAYEGGIMGAIEITPNADGTITLSNDRVLCFELTQMLSDEDIEMNLGFELEYNPDMTEEEQEAYRQNLRNSLMMKLPNLWLQPYFCWTDRVYMEDRPMYGDQTMWRFYFYDDLKDKTIEVEEYDYDLGDYVTKEVSVLPEDFETTAFSLSDGSVLIYSTHDMFGGLQNARENLHNSIRLRDVDDTIDFVGGTSVFDPETYEYIELNGGTQVSIYLYASDVVPAHTCEWSDWTAVEGTDTHTRTCTDETCGKTETKSHGWDNGTETEAPKCTEAGTTTYTCADCGATKTEDIAALDHDWGKWTYSTEDSHIRTCNRDCGAEEEIGDHEWGDWTSVDGDNHKKTCPICSGEQSDEHNFDDGEVVEPASHTSTGLKVYTCTDCGYSYDEEIPTTEGHEWGDWVANNDGTTHSRYCPCEESETDDHNFNDGEVVEPSSHTSTGLKVYTCTDCGYSYDEEIPTTEDHEWEEWVVNKEDEKNTHIHFCICNESETAPHNFDDGVVTLEATHTSKGVMTFTCGDCKYYYEEEIPETTEHEWTRWSPNDDGTHTRACRCNANETKDCIWDDGVITLEPTHFEEGEKTYTCTTCGNTKVEPIEKTTEHVWADWVGNNDGRTHTHECKCGETETLSHNWSSWTEQAAGGYQRVCEDCGASESMVLDEDKPVNTTPTTNAADTNLNNTDIELIDKVLTDEEQSQVATGADVSIYLVVEDISTEVSSNDKAAAEEKAEDSQIGMYLDIDLFKKVDTVETPVKETNGTVAITITIPENLINTDASITRTYKIIRVHDEGNGNLVTDVIEGIFNAENNTFTFETDKFSTYALAYADSAVEQDDPVEPDVPQTGDNSNWIAIMLVSGLGLALITNFGKKRIFAK